MPSLAPYHIPGCIMPCHTLTVDTMMRLHCWLDVGGQKFYFLKKKPFFLFFFCPSMRCIGVSPEVPWHATVDFDSLRSSIVATIRWNEIIIRLYWICSAEIVIWVWSMRPIPSGWKLFWLFSQDLTYQKCRAIASQTRHVTLMLLQT